MDKSIEAFNLLLYFKYHKNIASINENKIFEFANGRIVAIDEGKYNRVQRSELKDRFKIKTYCITSGVFDVILKKVCLKKSNFVLRGILFEDDSITTVEYSDIENLIYMDKFDKVYGETFNILDEYCTSIKMIKLFFKGYDFSIFVEGRIETYAPSKTVLELTQDEEFNKMILGV